MIDRAITSIVRRRLEDYPAVVLTGPRQAGKTTLARSLGGSYYDLEQEYDRLRLDLEWESVATGKNLAILDEAQADPAVFPRLRAAIDVSPRRTGRFLLLGSVSPSLMREVSESLAGRLSVVEIAPFTLDELPDVTPSRLWLTGGYPDGGVLQRRRYMGTLDAAADPLKADRHILVTQVREPADDGRRLSCDTRWLLSVIRELPG